MIRARVRAAAMGVVLIAAVAACGTDDEQPAPPSPTTEYLPGTTAGAARTTTAPISDSGPAITPPEGFDLQAPGPSADWGGRVRVG